MTGIHSSSGRAVNLGYLLLLALSCWGCATFQAMEGVDVSIVNLHFTEATVLETTAIFTLRLQNESPAPLTLEGGVHKFYLDGSFIGKGLTGDPVEVPRFGSVTQPVTVYLRNLSMARRLKSILEGQKMDYRVDSLLYRQEGSSRSRIRISNEGRLDLRDFQPTPTPGG